MDGTNRRLRRLNWYGLKGLTKHALALGPVNAPMLKIIDAMPAVKRRIHRFPVARAQVECRVDHGNSFVMLDPLSCSIAKEIHWGGGLRKMPEDRVAVRVFESLARKADWMLDIGAYTGFFSLLTCAVNRKTRVIAFEIVPENHALLLRNIRENKFAGRIDARLQGLGAAGDSMLVPESFHSSELPTSISREYQSDTGVRIPFDSLDRVAGELHGRGLIKVDVEGTEYELFEHGRELLARHRPDILCEVLGRSTTAPQLSALFKGLGYRLYKIVDTGLEERDTIQPDRRFKDWYFSMEAADIFLRRAH